MGRQQQYEALMEFMARVQAATGLPSPHIERLVANGLDITKATPADVYKLATGMDLPGPAQAYVPPAKQNVSMAIEGPSLEQRVANDPEIQSAIKMAGPAIARMNPELAQRVAAGDTDAMLEVYRMVVKNEGAMPVRQMELPLGDEAPSTGMIPFGVGGPGVPAGLAGPGISSPSRGDMILARILGLNGPQQGRLPAPSILGLPAPQQARLTGPGMLALPEGPIARRPGWHRSDAEMWQDNLDRIAERAYEFPDDAAPSVVDAIPASSYPAASPGHLVDDVYAPAGVTETGLSVPGVRGGGIPVGGPAGGPRGLSVPGRRSGISPLAATAAAGLAAGAAGIAANRLLQQSSPLTASEGPASSPLADDELTLSDDTPMDITSDGLADLAAETSPFQMIYPDGPPDSPNDRMRLARELSLGGTPISVRETLSGMGVGDLTPLRAAAINRAEADAAEAQAAMDRYNAKNNPWRSYGWVRSTR